jgi:hypothetical protein
MTARSNLGVINFETVDDAAWFLHAAGWSTGEACLAYPDGRLCCCVSVSVDRREIRAEGDTQTRAARLVNG